ncbi:PAS domain-containing sensor histidine kinase [Methylobacillus flagellatus]|uniref:PAS/PAC sensor signal transduction histidine kinase n=1 Tax=Methylobacillus flagellatus (strain ATCC 51484 / DSM 6875 / VKM B-1610 / KT) TaxID=265072 RepID=Q1H1T6_METFK|nr:PAS domain-containing sensor histidine kinase [Methylobacillus flagellatus]ABE49551.1 PAS/PAC sensor signal transduction histidine kinase [Methylobacillus flagellatus KT]
MRQFRPALQLPKSTPDLLATFPFHVIVDEQLIIHHASSALQSLDAGRLVGRKMDECFALLCPTEVFCLASLRNLRRQACLLKHKPSGLVLGGKVASHEEKYAAFLLMPWIEDTADVSNLRSIPKFSRVAGSQRLYSSVVNVRKLNAEKKRLFQAHALLSMRESESRTLTHIVSMTDNSVVIANALGYVEWVNDAYVRRSGYLPEEVVGRYLGDLMDGDEETVEQIRRQLDAKQSYQAELLRTAKDGSNYWVDLDIEPLFDGNGQVFNYIAVARDITEKKMAQETSSRLHGIMQSTFELSPDGLVTFNKKGMLSTFNPAFLNMTGLKPEQLREISQSEFIRLLKSLCQDDQGAVSQRLPDAVVMRMTKPKLTVIKHSVREAHDPENRFVGTIHYFRDITQESELHRMKGEFLSMAAHELRTPMSSIHGFTELLLKREFTPEQQKDMLATVHRQSVRLTKLINDMLDLAKIEARKGMSFDIKPYRLTDIVDTALKEFLVSGEGRAIKFHFNNHALKVSADFDKLIQALVNVLSNAHKYSDPSTEIHLYIKEKQQYQHTYVGIAVEDYGIGMSKEHMDHLFERFYRADVSGSIPGTGLGLCLVKEIMEIHGGWVDVSSVYGEGSVVTLWLKKLKD